MIIRVVKYGVIGAVGLLTLGGIVLGTDLTSYARSSVKTVQSSVKDSVPIEFELRRARDMLGEIIPEMQANIRLIAQEEVEISTLENEIDRSQASLEVEQARIAKLRDALTTRQVSYNWQGLNYTPQQVKEELARRFERYKEAEMVLAGKCKLLDSREKSLHAAVQMLDRTRMQKAQLEDQIEALEGQYRLVKAASVGSDLQMDGSKLAQTEKLIGQIRKRLDVAERVLAHESKFTQPIPVDVIDERELLEEIDAHFSPTQQNPVAVTTQPAGMVSTYDNELSGS
jgi:chromosome segregation ATPase